MDRHFVRWDGAVSHTLRIIWVKSSRVSGEYDGMLVVYVLILACGPPTWCTFLPLVYCGKTSRPSSRISSMTCYRTSYRIWKSNKLPVSVFVHIFRHLKTARSLLSNWLCVSWWKSCLPSFKAKAFTAPGNSCLLISVDAESSLGYFSNSSGSELQQ